MGKNQIKKDLIRRFLDSRIYITYSSNPGVDYGQWLRRKNRVPHLRRNYIVDLIKKQQ
jgi:hypothetical protein